MTVQQNSVQLLDGWYEANKKLLSQKCIQFIKIVLPRNIGYAGAINVGFALAIGEYIAVQDGDDKSAIQ